MSWRISICLFFGLLSLLGACSPTNSGDDANQSELTVWHSYPAGSVEEDLFESAVEGFRQTRPDLSVEVVRLPYLQIVSQFITAAQGGEAPDLVRLADSHLTQVGHITINDVPLLEDLRPHLTPSDLNRFDARSVDVMRMNNALLALPASQGAMSLLYNPDMFEAAGISPPTDDWTVDDMISATESFKTRGEIGLTVPLRWSYWTVSFMTAYGGDLFDDEGIAQFDAPGMSDALTLTRDLEFDRELVSGTTQIDTMKTRFSMGNSAMVIDGAWNIPDYREAGINVRQVLLPYHPSKRARMRSVSSAVGWGLSTQSANKPDAVELALWVTSDAVQQDYLDQTFTLPSSNRIMTAASKSNDPLVSGFVQQLDHTLVLPTKRGVQQIYLVLDTAIQLIVTNQQTPEEALVGATKEMRAVMAR